MRKINLGRVILGGLLAGVIMNISEFVLNTYVIADMGTAIMERLGLPPVGTNQIIVFVILTFVVGVILVWLYAAIRPRFGAGVKTAIIAAVTIWVLATLSSIGEVVLGVMMANELVLPAIWTLVEIVVAGIAGAWLYQEA